MSKFSLNLNSESPGGSPAFVRYFALFLLLGAFLSLPALFLLTKATGGHVRHIPDMPLQVEITKSTVKPITVEGLFR